jgi:hypothetical protein
MLVVAAAVVIKTQQVLEVMVVVETEQGLVEELLVP